MRQRKRSKKYALFAKTLNGRVYGFVEESFRMGWSGSHAKVYTNSAYQDADYVFQLLQKCQAMRYPEFRYDEKYPNHFWIAPADAPLQAGEVKALAIEKFFLVRINSKNPLKVDTQCQRYIYSRQGKYAARNRTFRIENSSI